MSDGHYQCIPHLAWFRLQDTAAPVPEVGILA